MKFFPPFSIIFLNNTNLIEAVDDFILLFNMLDISIDKTFNIEKD